MDNKYSEDNRKACAAATRPVLSAVESLVVFASSPEFSGEHAVIGPSARSAQQPVVSAGRDIIQASCDMIRAAKSLAVTPKDPPTWLLLANHSKSVSDSIKKLVASIRDKAPGQDQCDSAIKRITDQISQLDQATLLAVSTGLAPHKGNSIRGYAEMVQTAITEIVDTIEPIRNAAKAEAEHIGHSVTQLVVYIEPLVSASIAVASNISRSQQQTHLLDQSKSVAEAALQFIHVTKECGGNPKV
jgi:talin